MAVDQTPGTRTNDEIAAEARRAQAEMEKSLRASRDQAVDEARSAVRSVADSQKGRAVESMTGIARALHKSAQAFDDEKDAIPARYVARSVDGVAKRLDDVTNTLKNRDWDGLLDEAESLARRRPGLFIAGAMAAGFVLMRYLQTPPAGEMEPAEGMGMGSTGGDAAAAAKDFPPTGPIPGGGPA